MDVETPDSPAWISGFSLTPSLQRLAAARAGLNSDCVHPPRQQGEPPTLEQESWVSSTSWPGSPGDAWVPTGEDAVYSVWTRVVMEGRSQVKFCLGTWYLMLTAARYHTPIMCQVSTQHSIALNSHRKLRYKMLRDLHMPPC